MTFGHPTGTQGVYDGLLQSVVNPSMRVCGGRADKSGDHITESDDVSLCANIIGGETGRGLWKRSFAVKVTGAAIGEMTVRCSLVAFGGRAGMNRPSERMACPGTPAPNSQEAPPL
jgi:hypothetical protein